MDLNFDALRKEFPLLEAQDLSEQAAPIVRLQKMSRPRLKRTWKIACWSARIGTYGSTKNESVRALVAELLHAAPDEIAVTASVSAGLNALASALQFSAHATR